MRKLNSNQLNHIFNVTPRQPEIKSKFSKSLTQPSRITCSSIWFNMCYTTPAQPKIFTNKIIQRCTHSTWIFKLSENDFKCLHLHNLKSLGRYHVHYTRTTWLYDISTIWFQDSTPAQPEIFVDDMVFQYTRTTWLHYIRTTWLRSSTPAQPEIFILIVKWYISRYTRTPWFSLHLQNMISLAFSFLLCVYVLLYVIFRTYIYV